MEYLSGSDFKSLFKKGDQAMNFGLMLLLGYLLTKLLLPLLIKILAAAGITKDNWQGRPVIMMAGLIIPIVLILAYIPLSFILVNKPDEYLYLSAVCAVSLLGMTDDLLGGSAQKGIRGHFLYLWTQRRISTGVIKALGIGVVSLWMVIELQPDYVVLNWLVLVLSANFINLLDLRPGRAVKGFIIMFVLAGLLTQSAYLTQGSCVGEPYADYSMFAAVSVGIVLAYTCYDLRGVVMLGDTGSNTLGTIAGLMLLRGPLLARILMAFFLVLLHVAAEKYSFSKLIEQNSWLHDLDHWGRE